MTEKRYVISGDRSISDHQKKRLYDLNDFDGMISVTETLNELATKCSKLEKENEQLKSELQKIYEIATINKVRDIVDEVYDDLLYETSDESDYARKKVLKCLEMIDDYKDVIENV